MATSTDDCVFCNASGEKVIWSDARCRVLQVTDTPFAGFCRVVWNDHVTEFSDLDAHDRNHVMHVVAAVERSLRSLLSPHKMNVASLGNQTAHLHWHVIPRYRDDSHYPNPIWAAQQREGAARALPGGFTAQLRNGIESALA
jgi:diadenosine tetraphosphate (Ap4A) HIT family hydrolase